MVRDPATGQAICYACKLCERACPSDCITVDGAKLDGAKKKSVTLYKLDFTKCSLCGSCVEACRDGAIRFSRDYNLAGWTKEEFIMDLFAKLEAEAKADVVTAEPVKTEPEAPVAPQSSKVGRAVPCPPHDGSVTLVPISPTAGSGVPALPTAPVTDAVPAPAAVTPKAEPPKMEPVKVDAP